MRNVTATGCPDNLVRVVHRSPGQVYRQSRYGLRRQFDTHRNALPFFGQQIRVPSEYKVREVDERLPRRGRQRAVGILPSDRVAETNARPGSSSSHSAFKAIATKFLPNPEIIGIFQPVPGGWDDVRGRNVRMQSDRADRAPDRAYRPGGVGIIVVVVIPPYRRGQIQRFQNRRRELGKEPDVVISQTSLSQTPNRIPKPGSSVQ